MSIHMYCFVAKAHARLDQLNSPPVALKPYEGYFFAGIMAWHVMQVWHNRIKGNFNSLHVFWYYV